MTSFQFNLFVASAIWLCSDVRQFISSVATCLSTRSLMPFSLAIFVLCHCRLGAQSEIENGEKVGKKDQMLGIPLFLKYTLDAFTCAVGLWLPQINPCFINSHEPDMWKWKTVASCDEVRWQNFICGQFWQYDGILKCQPFFLGQEYLSCSNCHINWFCLTELDRHHIQNVNSSLWLRCIQVWRPITVSRFVPLNLFFYK